MMTPAPKGFALLISIILTSVLLAVGAALLDVAYKQILLSSSAKNSQYAFYNADSALECALYYDQKVSGAFAYDTASPPSVTCNGLAVTGFSQTTMSQSPRTTTFDLPCAGGGTSARITIIKQSSGSTDIYSNGYNTCDATNSNRIERGLKVHY